MILRVAILKQSQTKTFSYFRIHCQSKAYILVKIWIFGGKLWMLDEIQDLSGNPRKIVSQNQKSQSKSENVSQNPRSKWESENFERNASSEAKCENMCGKSTFGIFTKNVRRNLSYWTWDVGLEMSDLSCRTWVVGLEMSDLSCRTWVESWIWCRNSDFDWISVLNSTLLCWHVVGAIKWNFPSTVQIREKSAYFEQKCAESSSCCNMVAPWANLNFKIPSCTAFSKLLKMWVVSLAPIKSTWVQSFADQTTSHFPSNDFRRWITSIQSNFQNLPSIHTPTTDSVASAQVPQCRISSKIRCYSDCAHSVTKCRNSLIFTFWWSDFCNESGALAAI